MATTGVSNTLAVSPTSTSTAANQPTTNLATPTNPTSASQSTGVTDPMGTQQSNVNAVQGNGIINSALSTSTPANPVAGYNANTVAAPTNWTVDPSQTAAGQLSSLTSQDSPLMQQARTSALQQMNARGILNSSMAVGASDAAAYAAATPIAQQDASTNAAAAQTNAAAANTISTNNQNAANTAQQFNATQMNNANLAQLNNQYNELIQNNAQARQLMSDATSAVNNIANNTTMDSATKTANMNQIYSNLQMQLGVLSGTSNLNLGSIVNPYNTGSSAAAAPAAPPPSTDPTNGMGGGGS